MNVEMTLEEFSSLHFRDELITDPLPNLFYRVRDESNIVVEAIFSPNGRYCWSAFTVNLRE